LILLFFLLSLFFCFLSYVNIDPIKRSFFLITCLIVSSFFLSVGSYIWYSYFVCLLFLSGIFVIIVYFSSLSKITKVRKRFLLPIFTIIFLSFPQILSYNPKVNLSRFYFDLNIFVLMYIIFFLIFFLNFSSYVLSFAGALRKI